MAKRKGPTPRRRWIPLVECSTVIDQKGERPVPDGERVWGNDLYTVMAEGLIYPNGRRAVHLSIHRKDRDPLIDWRHLQRIKNETVGPEVEAVQIFPAESNLVDTSNEFHLWAPVADDNPESYEPFWFGFHSGRLVADHDASPVSWARQRPLDDDATGVVTAAELEETIRRSAPADAARMYD